MPRLNSASENPLGPLKSAAAGMNSENRWMRSGTRSCRRSRNCYRPMKQAFIPPILKVREAAKEAAEYPWEGLREGEDNDKYPAA